MGSLTYSSSKFGNSLVLTQFSLIEDNRVAFQLLFFPINIFL